MNICMIGAAPFVHHFKRKNCEIFTVNLIEQALNLKSSIDFATIPPAEYHKFFEVFFKKEADKLPEHKFYDHTINTINVIGLLI